MMTKIAILQRSKMQLNLLKMLKGSSLINNCHLSGIEDRNGKLMRKIGASLSSTTSTILLLNTLIKLIYQYCHDTLHFSS